MNGEGRVLAAGYEQISRTAVETIVRQVVLEHLGYRQEKAAPTLTVHASARHMHVSREDLDTLFGPGYELTEYRPLFQPGNFASNELVTLIGPRGRVISNLRILGPLRKESQVELAFTDAISLGFDNIPLRLSGNLEGTPGAVIMGPKGVVELNKGIIRAAIHVHMNPEDAKHFGVKKGDMMKLRVGGPAGVTFNNVHVRIDPTSKLNVHMDTDEANACGLHLSKKVELFK
jgi:putative phosphotransacetylase